MKRLFAVTDKEVKKAERSFVPCKPVIWLKVNWLNDFKPTCNGNISWSKRQNQCDNEVDLLSGINRNAYCHQMRLALSNHHCL